MCQQENLAINETSLGTSYFQARERFSIDRKAGQYPSEYRAGNRRDEREKHTILRLMSLVPAGSHVLDIPCGTGRLTKLLVEKAYRVRGADSSRAMLSLSRRNYERWRKRPGGELPLQSVEFDQEDIMRTGYPDKTFDAVICNRLFHHFTESRTRLAALEELRRICSGILIVSFFNSRSLDAWRHRVWNFIKGKIPTDRIPIPVTLFASELNEAGFDVIGKADVWRYVSPLCYFVARPSI